MRKLLILLGICCHAFAQSPSNLPLIIIDTQGRTIKDEPKILAKMKIIDNGEGHINQTTDAAVFDGDIGIEYRGSSSQMFPKKPFGLETWDKDQEDLDVSLFGWPKESDWILFASYNEKSLIHNVLALRMAREMGLYASRTRYVELYLNRQYEGVYVFMEKIKRDKGRVDIAKLDPEEESGDDLTGGYILKIDKNTGTNDGSFFSDYSNLSLSHKPTEFFYEYPGPPTGIQQNYIKDYIKRFENSLMQKDFADATDNYRDYIDLKSFVLLTLLNEVTKNVDAYRISTFLYKDKDSNGGKLTLGPPWDYDLSFGNADYCEARFTEGFSYRLNYICPKENWFVPFWWDRFLADPVFVENLRKTYDDLRQNGVLQETELLKIIDEYATEIRQAQVRNFNKWPILGVYVWPQPFPYATTWQGEVDELKNWLGKRLLWLDDNLPKPVTYPLATDQGDSQITIFPNPFTETISVKLNTKSTGNVRMELLNSAGQTLFGETYSLSPGNHLLNLKANQGLENQAIYFLKISRENKEEVIRLVRH